MRLISLHNDTVRLLERLRIPFDDVTPEGLWGSPYHLIGLTDEQRAVLDSWNLNVDDITPGTFGGNGVSSGAGLAEHRATWRPETRQDAPRDAARPASAQSFGDPGPVIGGEPKHHGDPLGDVAGERAMVGRAAAAAEAGAGQSVQREANGNGSTAAGTAPGVARDDMKIRVSVGGKYRDAAVKKGKIVLDGQSYDSPAQATKSVAPAKGDWVFWEYFDSEAGKWRMLDRDWRPGSPT